jgi:hypothetical protein
MEDIQVLIVIATLEEQGLLRVWDCGSSAAGPLRREAAGVSDAVRL